VGRGWLLGGRACFPICAVAVVAAVFGPAASPARACSGPPYDVNRADVIAEGWVEQVTIGPETTGFGSFHPVQVTLRVVRSLKGDAPTPLVFTDSNSYFPDPSGGPNGFWAGSSGACGTLDADPTGQYALIVFERRDDKLLTTPIMGAVFRDAPDDPTVDRFRTYLEDRLAPGDSPRVVPVEATWTAWLTATGWPYLLAGVVIVVTVGVVGALWGRERWRNA
jgi:hypothetical protein